MQHLNLNILEPLYLDNNTTNNLFLARHKNEQYLVKTYSGDKKSLKQQTEAQFLTHWANEGFPVPKLFNATINIASNSPFLVLEYIEGQTLMHFLKDSSISREIKVQTLSAIFKSNANRHKIALQNQDHRLVHHDLNSGNILIKDKRSFFYIDFEGSFADSKRNKNIQDKISIEVAKLVRWSARDMGRENLSAILELMLGAYKGTEVPSSIVKRIHNRSFQYIHRWKDKRKKKKLPDEITKYDIANELKRLLNTR